MNEIDNLLDIAKRRLDAAAYAWKSTGEALQCEDEFECLFGAMKRLQNHFENKLNKGE